MPLVEAATLEPLAQGQDDRLSVSREPGRVLRFLAVALGCFAVDLAVVAAASHLLPTVLLPVALGWSANVVTGFGLHRWLVFDDGRNPLHLAGRRYAALTCVNAAVGVGLVSWIVSAGAPYLVVRLASSLALMVLNYVLCRHWVYDDRRPALLPAGP